MKRLTALCLLLMQLLCHARAQAPAVKDMSLDLLGSSVHYPQLTGLADPAVQSAVNAAIMDKGRINERLTRMALLLDSPVKLRVTYTHTLAEELFSCALLASGAVETSRDTQVWTTVNMDLRTGREITFADLFADADAASAFLASYLDEQVAPELSAHLAAGSLTPIPADFTLSPTGLTLYYDIDNFRTLSDKAGTVTILWSEMREHLLLTPGSILDDFGVDDHIALGEDDAQKISDTLQSGAFPGVPASIDQPLPELIDRYALLTDPDIYEGGRMIALEDGAFRGVFILTDALTEEFDQSVVQGIRADRLNCYGLCTGETTMDDWRTMLGDPDTTLAVNQARADAWRIVPGTSDYYTYGDYRLRLHADENGVLRSIFLTK